MVGFGGFEPKGRRVAIYDEYGNPIDGDNPFPITEGFNIPEYDEIALTYVSSGNGTGKIETAIYKLATVTLVTLTLSYDANNKISGVIKT